MTRYSGVLQRPSAADTDVVLQVSENRCTIVGAPGRWIGAWPLDEARFERVSIREFSFRADREEWTFVANDPAGFAAAVGVVVDLRQTSSRFGLAERLRRAREEERAGS